MSMWSPQRVGVGSLAALNDVDKIPALGLGWSVPTPMDLRGVR
jgi:hypothetical protein